MPKKGKGQNRDSAAFFLLLDDPRRSAVAAVAYFPHRADT